MSVSGRSDFADGRCRQLERDHAQLSDAIPAQKKFAPFNAFYSRSRSELARGTSCPRSVTIDKSGIEELTWS
jgi:hypothetical protein